MSELTKAQRDMLEFYAHNGLTAQTPPCGGLSTWVSLINRGLLIRSNGLGIIETDITPAGLRALQERP